MSIKTFNCKYKNNRQLRLGIEATIDELTEIETKICAKLMKNPDCVQEAPQPFIDTNPDYVNPLKLKDNSSRIRVFEHIEKAELLAENDSDYVMQPFPLYDSISWTLESQIPIKNYEFTPSMDVDSQILEPTKNNGSTFLSSLLPIVASNDEGWLDLVPPTQEEIDSELTTFKELSSLANIVSCSYVNSNIGAGIWNTQLQTIAEEYCGDNKSVDVSLVTTPIFDMEDPEANICLNNSASKDKFCALDFGVVSGETNKILEITPENQSQNGYIMDIFSRNYTSKTKTNGFHWPVQIGNAVDEKTNLKFQYAAVIGDNLEKKNSNSEDCIILVCKECGFHEYI